MCKIIQILKVCKWLPTSASVGVDPPGLATLRPIRGPSVIYEEKNTLSRWFQHLPGEAPQQEKSHYSFIVSADSWAAGAGTGAAGQGQSSRAAELQSCRAAALGHGKGTRRFSAVKAPQVSADPRDLCGAIRRPGWRLRGRWITVVMSWFIF